MWMPFKLPSSKWWVILSSQKQALITLLDFLKNCRPISLVNVDGMMMMMVSWCFGWDCDYQLMWYKRKDTEKYPQHKTKANQLWFFATPRNTHPGTCITTDYYEWPYFKSGLLTQNKCFWITVKSFWHLKQKWQPWNDWKTVLIDNEQLLNCDKRWIKMHLSHQS